MLAAYYDAYSLLNTSGGRELGVATPQELQLPFWFSFIGWRWALGNYDTARTIDEDNGAFSSQWLLFLQPCDSALRPKRWCAATPVYRGTRARHDHHPRLPNSCWHSRRMLCLEVLGNASTKTTDVAAYEPSC